MGFSKTRVWLSAWPVLLAAATGYAAAPNAPVDAGTLFRSADFVGIVLAQLTTTDLVTNEQGVQLYEVDPIKGSLAKTNSVPPYPWVSGKPTEVPSRPTHYSEKAYHLVFLSKPSPPAHRRWNTLACYRVEYRPDANGKIVGRLAGYPGASANADLETARRLLLDIVAGGYRSAVAAAKLNPMLESAARAAQHEPKTHEEQMAIATPLAASIRVGTLRSEIEKVFLQQDGGLSGPGETRYYLGNEVMVGVPYDETGGYWKPANRVTGPLKVHRDDLHID